jgi:protein-S-isoprenylcysteine O-methyltransferase Ste14
MAAPEQRRGLVVAISVANLILTVGLGALAWGGLTAFLAHPARAAFVGAIVIMTLVGLASPVNLSSGEREAVESPWFFVLAAGGSLLLAWQMPHLDRRDVWTIDGDAARYAGVVILLVGGILRIWPMFVLGRRFSGFVAIQPDHELVTSGPYRWIRHPSYLGAMLAFVGWALVFRSVVGLVAAALGLLLLHVRIESEEALLASQFGRAYADYRARTWRLLPGVY